MTAQAEQPVAEPVWIQPDVLKYIRLEKERNACGVVYGTPSEHHTVPLYARPSAWVYAGKRLPEKSGWYQCWLDYGDEAPLPDTIWWNGQNFIDGAQPSGTAVTHWQPITPPSAGRGRG